MLNNWQLHDSIKEAIQRHDNHKIAHIQSKMTGYKDGIQRFSIEIHVDTRAGLKKGTELNR